jgi:aminoglycoside 6'-N-acetyltransferase I
VEIIEAAEPYLEAWLSLRKQLWPDPDDVHLSEMHTILASETAIAFLLVPAAGEAVGFIEGALYFNASQAYGYVEGWFVVPAYRRQGLGGQLLAALEEWMLHHSIHLSLSDTIPEEYPLSSQAHVKYGYRPLKTVQIFIKALSEQGA